jgi:hypothetical protein
MFTQPFRKALGIGVLVTCAFSWCVIESIHADPPACATQCKCKPVSAWYNGTYIVGAFVLGSTSSVPDSDTAILNINATGGCSANNFLN